MRREGVADAIPAMAQMYRTPESVEYRVTGKRLPPASDVFQLGLVAAELFTGKNPLRPGGPKKPVQLEALADLPGAIGETIKARLQEMIIIETEARPPARLLLPRWLDLYRTVSRRQGPGQRDAVVRPPVASSVGESAPQSPARGPQL